MCLCLVYVCSELLGFLYGFTVVFAFCRCFFLLVFCHRCIRSYGGKGGDGNGMTVMEIRRNNEDGDNDRDG